MKKITFCLALVIILLLSNSVLAANPARAAQAHESREVPGQEVVTLQKDLGVGDIAAILARLDDDQVRRLLIAQLQAEAQRGLAADIPQESAFVRAVRWFDSRYELFVSRSVRLVESLPAIPGDVAKAVTRLTDDRGAGQLWKMVLIVLVFLAAGYLAERTFDRLTVHFRSQVENMPGMEGILKFWGALIHFIPKLLGLAVFFLVAFTLFLLFIDKEERGLRLLFLAVLLATTVIRLAADLLQIVFSKATAKLRLIRISDATAHYLSHRLLLATGILAVGMIGLVLLQHLNTILPTQTWWYFIFGSTIILILAEMVWGNRLRVKEHLMQPGLVESKTGRWLRRQFADMWHILVTAYLFLVWLLAMVNLVMADAIRFRGTFVLSILIVPIYLVLDRLAVWCFESTVVKKTAERFEAPAEEAAEKSGTEAAETSQADKGSYLVIVRRVVRLVVFIAVMLWFLDVWGLGVPIGEEAVDAVVEILVTLLLAHAAWDFISTAIGRKLAEGGYVVEAEKEGEDDEWGGGVAQDRSQTLLPMLRKFLGVVIVVMTTLIVLSALGINIGPLLAGAGVVGLAIGFGAQKLVRDILSGIFFLMDDAFRVGEYLDAGGVSGTVEQITLRTIKLRHHRGMLQIVPLGDLKSITNFMRGGIVVKFNLQLPYDTDIEKVRKIIKKVGKAMLLDENLGPDFIKPVKSQGVRSVGDSVMTFRVKFTARPGTHFVIRREAFRRITEALEKRGIHYAHRKVIVDLAPELAEKMDVGPASTARAGEAPSEELTSEQKKQAVTAGAAAALDTILEKEGGESKGK